MKQETEIRIFRYGFGLLHIFVFIFAFWVIHLIETNIYLLKDNPCFLIISLTILLSIGLGNCGWGLILIVRCEEFIKNKEYIVKK
jgi:hypothetical protein